MTISDAWWLCFIWIVSVNHKYSAKNKKIWCCSRILVVQNIACGWIILAYSSLHFMTNWGNLQQSLFLKISYLIFPHMTLYCPTKVSFKQCFFLSCDFFHIKNINIWFVKSVIILCFTYIYIQKFPYNEVNRVSFLLPTSNNDFCGSW